jgi:uncharacterized protein
VEPTVVTVAGEASREVPPELAVFSVVVSAAGKDRADLLARLTRQATAVGAMLDRFGPAVERRETAGVEVYPEVKKKLYRGSVATTVTVTDFEALGGLLAELAAQELTSISGPWWQLRPGSRADAGVRREAVADALRRARDYAAAVGASLSRILEISESEGHGSHRMMMRAGSVADTAESAEFDLYPQQQTVEARVLLRVAITEPTVLGSDPAVS